MSSTWNQFSNLYTTSNNKIKVFFLFTSSDFPSFSHVCKQNQSFVFCHVQMWKILCFNFFVMWKCIKRYILTFLLRKMLYEIKTVSGKTYFCSPLYFGFASVIILVVTLWKTTYAWNSILVSDCNGTRTHNHLVRRRTLSHLFYPLCIPLLMRSRLYFCSSNLG